MAKKYENIHFSQGPKIVNNYYDDKGKLISRNEGRLYNRDKSISFVSSSSSSVPNLIMIVFVMLLVYALFRVFFSSGQTLTFTGLLDTLANFKAPFPNLSIANNAITAEWGIFNFFKDFLNIFINIFDFATFLAKSMTNLASYIFEIIRFVF